MAPRRIRIVCISDTHNQSPKLPPGDILIHAGDLTNQGSFSELEKTFTWLQQADFQIKILICGNHGVTCDATFYAQYGGYFHNKKLECSQQCIDLLRSDPSIVYLCHETKVVTLRYEDNTIARLKIFGSPYSPARGFWAFGYPPETSPQLWDQIPLDADVVVTHTPPKFHRDESGTHGASGCEQLRRALWRVRPRLSVCGHIHEAYGVEVVTWDLSSANVKFKESHVQRFEEPPPLSKKQFIVDLSQRSKSHALLNDGSVGNMSSPCTTALKPQTRHRAAIQGSLPDFPSPAPYPFPDAHKARCPIPNAPNPVDGTADPHGTYGQGGLSSSGRLDREAICGRRGRQETCVVNAAYMATNWPHKGGKKFNRPIILDMEFPLVQQMEFQAL